MPLMGFYRWTVPFFGVFLSGLPGAAILLIYVVLFAYAAWGTYKLQNGAWWLGFLLTIVYDLSMGITFSRVNLLEFYQEIGVVKESLGTIQGLQMFRDPRVVMLGGIVIISFLGFFLYTKKFFKTSVR
jgi:hypothetical protein